MTKQAVIVVHGMGEQRPMGTMRDLVNALANGKERFVIPDQSTGSSELSRVRVVGPNKGDRTDFFELYYADLLGGGNFSQLRGWVLGLLFRWPHQVPREVWKIWAFLWGAVFFTLIWLGPLLVDDPLGKVTDIFKPKVNVSNQPSDFQIFLIVTSCLLLATKLAHMAKHHVENQDTKPDVKRTLHPNFSYLLPILASIILGWVLWHAVPWSAFVWPNQQWCINGASQVSCVQDVIFTFFSQVWVKLIVAAALWFGIKSFGVAYFGDVARYVDTSHIAIASRSAIRERAVGLLGTLHSRRAYKAGIEQTDAPEYDRILILAHSLGSVVAYDAMRIYWAQKNYNKGRVIDKNSLKAFTELDRLAGKTPSIDDNGPHASQWDAEYSHQQKEAFKTFCHKNPEWRISDFITMGSPLARADFLMSRDLPRFRKNTDDRVYPTSPPFLEGEGSFLHNSQRAGGVIPHHAAMFSVTQWLAIFDPVRGWLFRGDFIGGPVRFLFGRGVQELAVKMSRGGFFGSVVTHTNYWDPTVTTQVDDEKTHVDNIAFYKTGDDQIVIKALKEKIWPSAQAKTGSQTPNEIEPDTSV